MHDMNWDDLRFVLAAARAGSLTAASRVLGIHQPTVGRRIDSLEKSLGVRLFQRHSQGLTLTEEGRRVVLAAEAMENASRTLEFGGKSENTITGTVKLALPPGIAAHVIGPRIHELLNKLPLLKVIVLSSPYSADLRLF
jgi:DNA-binding transcriptional LysR family regulator